MRRTSRRPTAAARAVTLVDGLEARFVIDASARQIALGGQLSHPTASGSEISERRVYVLDVDGTSRQRLTAHVCSVAAWGAPGHPFVRLPSFGFEPCEAAAFGPRVEDIGLGEVGDFPSTSVSPNGAWRIIFGRIGWRLFDVDSQPRARRSQGRLTEITSRPDERGFFWRSIDGMWYAGVPDDEPRLVAPWPNARHAWFDWTWWTTLVQRQALGAHFFGERPYV